MLPTSSEDSHVVHRWGVRHPAATERAPRRLFCLPHAGGAAAPYRALGRALAPQVEVHAVELPGHGRRLGEPLLTEPHELVEVLLDELGDAFDEEPYALLGHSLGGLLAHELSRECARRGRRSPSRLVLSAVRPPCSPPGVLHLLDDDALVARLTLLWPRSAALEDPELQALLLPVVRADLRVAETWPCTPGSPSDVPVLLLAGREDQLLDPQDMDAWQDWFSAEVERRAFDGDHFFLLSAPGVQDVLRSLHAPAAGA